MDETTLDMLRQDYLNARRINKQMKDPRQKQYNRIEPELLKIVHKVAYEMSIPKRVAEEMYISQFRFFRHHIEQHHESVQQSYGKMAIPGLGYIIVNKRHFFKFLVERFGISNEIYEAITRVIYRRKKILAEKNNK